MPTRRILLGFLPLFLLLTGASCSSTGDPAHAPAEEATTAADARAGAIATGGYVIERVKIDRLTNNDRLGDADALVAFNRERRLWGAITSAEQRERFGQYFTVDWEGPDHTGAVATIRFEYRQQKTGAEVSVLENTVEVTGGEQFETFAVVGDSYSRNGLVTAWQVSVLVDGQVVASQPSFLWN